MNDELLLKELNESKSLIDDEYTATPEDIAREIDDVIREHSGDKRDNDFRQVVNLLDELVSQDEEWFKKYFPYFYDRRTELFVQAIGDESERRNVLDIVQAKDNSKLEVLAKIAKNPEEVTSEEVEKLGLDLSRLVNSQKNAQTEDAGNAENLDSGDDESSSYSSFVKDDDSVSDKESALKYGELGETWAKAFYEKQGYQVGKQPDYAGYDFLCEKAESELKIEVKAITYDRPNIRLTKNEWKKAIEYGNDYELFICSHDRGSKKHFIRVKKLWSTLQSRLAKLHTKRKTSVSYGSNEIESLVGFQQNENGQRNDIVLNWHRLFRDSNLEDIETYIYDESTSTFKSLRMDY